MNRFEYFIKPLTWFMALLLTAFVAGCGGSDTPAPAALSSAKAITAYSIGGVAGTIDETAQTIAVTQPYGTNVTALVATFTTTGASVKVGSPEIAQVSAETENDFTNPVEYKVTAANGRWATYTVVVTVASNTAKAITAFSFVGYPGSTGTITGTASPFAIAVTVPYETDVTALIASFTTTGASVTVDPTGTQTNESTDNNFTSPVTYRVAAADLSTADYIVTVTVAANTAKAITAFSFVGFDGNSGVINETTPKTIAVTLPDGTSVMALTANFTTSGASVKIGSAIQTSGTTANNFTTAKVYTVTAADASAVDYTVTVTLAAAGAVACTGTVADCVDLGTAANYVILDEATVTYTPTATTGPATITGDIGLSPAAASFFIGFPTSPPLDATECFSTSPQVTGKLYAADYNTLGCTTPTILGSAKNDKNFAYGFAAGKATAGGGLPVGTPTECPGVGAMSDVNNALAGGGGFPTTGLPAGVYTCTVAITIPGDLTLNGSATDVWVFKTTQTLEQANSTNVLLTGGAQPQNVFWQVAGNVLIQGAAHMEGVILTASNIQLITSATVKGRLLATSGVAMDSNTVVQPTP